jgi:O-antigen ligase
MKLLASQRGAAPGISVPQAPETARRGARRRLARGAAFKRGVESVARRNRHRLAFAGVVAFSLLLYLRPQDLFPGLIGEFPLAKIVGAVTLVVYIFSRLHWGEKLTILPLEAKMVVTIFGLGWLMAPFALEPGRSFETLLDTYIKVLLIFLMMINLIDKRERLLLIIKAIMICGAILGVGAVKSYAEGNLKMEGSRIEGMVGGIFGNPNDLATSLNLLIPLAVILAVTQRGLWRWLSLASVSVMTLGVIVTFSRGGFLGLMLGVGFLLWRLGEKSRARTVFLAAVAGGILLVAMPGSYSSRLLTILDTKSDETGSAQERRALLDRAISLAVKRPIIGVGMSNFPIYSVNQRVAHNSYLEISAELGLAGLIAYLILIFAPLRTCRAIERETKPGEDRAAPIEERGSKLEERGARSEERGEARRRSAIFDPRSAIFDSAAARRRELYLLSVGLEATLYVYILCSFFASIQYLWFLYYPVAYVVALKRIKEAEEGPDRKEPVSRWAAPMDGVMRRVRGSLWKSKPRAAGEAQRREEANGVEEVSGGAFPARKSGWLFDRRRRRA